MKNIEIKKNNIFLCHRSAKFNPHEILPKYVNSQKYAKINTREMCNESFAKLISRKN